MEKYIEDCLQSLLAQDYPTDAYEILMIDNNSTDTSSRIVRQYPMVRLLREEKQGAYAARNRGIAEAQGAVIAFTDPDCAPGKDWLRTIDVALRSPEVHLVIGRCQLPTRSLTLSLLMAQEHQKLNFILNSATKELYYGYTNNMAVRRDVFDRLGFFLERARGADRIFVRRTVEEYSCDAVRYEAAMHVLHQEITSLWKYFQKQWIYGYSNRLCDEVILTRSPTIRERSRIFRETVRKEGYSAAQASLLLGVFAVCVACYRAGRWSAVWSLGRQSAAEKSGRKGSAQIGGG
jgi:glycosyltransferase involved in cell wall biosynthesis